MVSAHWQQRLTQRDSWYLYKQLAHSLMLGLNYIEIQRNTPLCQLHYYVQQTAKLLTPSYLALRSSTKCPAVDIKAVDDLVGSVNLLTKVCLLHDWATLNELIRRHISMNEKLLYFGWHLTELKFFGFHWQKSLYRCRWQYLIEW